MTAYSIYSVNLRGRLLHHGLNSQHDKGPTSHGSKGNKIKLIVHEINQSMSSAHCIQHYWSINTGIDVKLTTLLCNNHVMINYI
jgi:hypothetical protein